MIYFSSRFLDKNRLLRQEETVWRLKWPITDEAHFCLRVKEYKGERDFTFYFKHFLFITLKQKQN